MVNVAESAGSGDDVYTAIRGATRPPPLTRSGEIVMSHTHQIETRDVRGPPLTGIPRRNGRRASKADFRSARDLKAGLAETTASIIARCGDPARVLEFYYWSRDPELAGIIRAIVGLPVISRTILAQLLTKTSDPQLISVRAERSGRLTLSLPRTSKAGKTKSRR
jgi:hypothetical protein